MSKVSAKVNNGVDAASSCFTCTTVRLTALYNSLYKLNHMAMHQSSFEPYTKVRCKSTEYLQQRDKELFYYTPGSTWSTARRMNNLSTQILHKRDIFDWTNPFWMIIRKEKKRFGSNVTPRLVVQGRYNQPDNEMSFKSKTFSVTFKTLKAIPSIDYHWWRSFT